MNVDEYLDSDEFRSFLDEGLRQEAINAADAIIRKGCSHVKRHQLYAIPTALQAGGVGELVNLTQNQKSKNTKKVNEEFWSAVYNIVYEGSRTDFSLYRTVKKELTKYGMISDKSQGETKREQNKIKNENKKLIKAVMNDELMHVYFEHFNCHFFYKTNSN